MAISSKKAVCSIVAKNYISYARVLSKSLKEYNPDVDVYILIVDDWNGFIDQSNENFKILSINQIDVPDFRQMAFYYNIVEFSTAVKPWLIEYLLKQGYEKVFYIDPDIKVYNNLEFLFEHLDVSEVLLTPHTCTDFPADLHTPNIHLVMMHGLYNLGFIGISNRETSLKLLKWWKGKLATNCIIDFFNGLFVDQKYMDLLPLLYSGVRIVTHPGCNVSYWNLHERVVLNKDDRWYSNSELLMFYHFSSFRPDNSEVLSPHCTRYGFHNKKEIESLFSDYARELTESNFYTTSKWPYCFNEFQDGAPISNGIRKLYLERVRRGERINNPFASKCEVESFLGLQKVACKRSRLKTFFRLCTPPLLWSALHELKNAACTTGKPQFD